MQKLINSIIIDKPTNHFFLFQVQDAAPHQPPPAHAAPPVPPGVPPADEGNGQVATHRGQTPPVRLRVPHRHGDSVHQGEEGNLGRNL